MMQTYDLAVIGSGLGGLECGVLAARQGRRVLVLERASAYGGCLQSFSRMGLFFDTGVHYVGGLDSGESLHQAFQQLGLMELPWIRMDENFDRVWCHNREYVLSCGGLDRFEQSLTEQFPQAERAVMAFVDRMRMNNLQDMDVSARTFLQQVGADEVLTAVLCAPAMRVGLHADMPLFCLTHAWQSYAQSSWRLKGPGSLIADRLKQQIEETGGRVLCHKEVTALSVDEGRVQRIVVADGSEYRAECVVSDVHPEVLCRMLQGKLPPRSRTFIHRLTSSENTPGMFTASLLLKPNAIPYRAHNIYYCSDGDVWTDRHDMVMLSFRTPDSGSRYVRQLDLLSPMTWQECLPWENTSVGHRGNDYRLLMQHKTDFCISCAEQVIPNLRKSIEEVFTASPLTYRDYLNIPQGAAFGIRKDYKRSMQCFHSVSTPLQNLFLTGANVLLPGIEGVTRCAFETCRRMGLQV